MARLALALLLAYVGPPSISAPAQEPAVPEEVAFPGPDGVSLRALLVRPTGPVVRATIIALHGCAGLAAPDRPLRLPTREADWAARLTALGHPMLFPDSFGSRGSGGGCGVPGFAISAAGPRRQDTYAAARWAATQPWSAKGDGSGAAVLLGWSDGGSTLLAAVNDAPPGLLRAAIGFYPGCGDTFRAGSSWSPGLPMLFLLGASDNWTQARFCQGLAQAYPSLITAVTYPDAFHGFDHPALSLRSRILPDGRHVTQGTQAAARTDALLQVPRFLAEHGR